MNISKTLLLKTKYIINLIYSYLGRTSLMWAAHTGNTGVVKNLLENGADIHAKDNDG